MNRERSSNIELLKIFAIIFIVLAHSQPRAESVTGGGNIVYLLDFSASTTSFQQLLMLFFDYSSQIANCIFVICSAFFLIDKDNVKYNKALYLASDLTTISLLFLIIVFPIYKKRITSKIFLSQFIPLLTSANWFVSCYILLYLIHPFLNRIICSLTQKKLLTVVIIEIVLYSVIDVVFPSTQFYYTPLVGFIVVYTIEAYIKIYMENFQSKVRLNILLAVFSLIILVLILLTTNIIGLKVEQLSHLMNHWKTFMNPFILLFSFSVFNLFRRMNVKNNKIINYFSQLSLLIYVIHENQLFREYMRADYFKYVYYHFTYDRIILWCWLLAAFSLLGSILIAVVYKLTLQKILYKICDNITVVLQKLYYKYIDFLLEIK